LVALEVEQRGKLLRACQEVVDLAAVVYARSFEQTLKLQILLIARRFRCDADLCGR
jgi:hypothetical protein